jgi:HlyD family secretion protein
MKTWQEKLRRTLIWLLLIGAVGAAIYIKVLRPTEVRSQRVTRGVVVEEALGTGSVESRRMINVSFEVTGRIVRILVDQGDPVKQGQELAAIDDRTFLAEVALAEQEVALARSTLQRLGADIERAQAMLKGAEDNLARVLPLVESGAASAEDLDVADERFRVASAELAGAQAGELEGREGISTAQRRLDRARAELERTVVRSPFDGVVLRRVREVGDVAVPGAEVLGLAATDTVWASVWVDETHLDALTVGLPARLALRSDPQRALVGTVARVGREVDRETRELMVDVSFHVLPERLAFGQRVDLWIELDRKIDVLRVPSSYIIHQDGTVGVLVAEGERARFRALQLGKRGGAVTEVTSGLEEGDVVLDPQISKQKRLKPGRRIHLREAGAEEGA